MSKRFKIGDKVRLCASPEKIGIIKNKIINRTSEKYVDVKYIVKFGQFLEDWKECKKSELLKINKDEYNFDKTVVFSHLYGLPDDRSLILVGVLEQLSDEPHMKLYMSKDGQMLSNFELFNKSVKYKRLSIGHAICNPEDKFEFGVGEKIAKSRAKSRPLSVLVSDFRGEFNDKTVNAIMDAKSEFIKENVDKFINDKVRFS